MASLDPGIRIGNAAHFHSDRSWADRLRINSGVICDRNRFWPREDWHVLSADEVSLVTTADVDSPDVLQLFNSPERLRARWWEVAAAPPDSVEKEGTTFRRFAAEMLEYLQFKQLPLSASCAFEVVVNSPGLASVRPEMGGLAAQWQLDGILGGINLGDQETALIVLNLSEMQMDRWLASPPAESTFHQRVRAFLTQQPDYPLIRVALLPGEGFWLPAIPVAFDGDTRGRTEVDVQLLIRKSTTANEAK